MINPEVFVIENVQGLKSMRDERGKLVVDTIKRKAKYMKYHIQIHLLNAENFGVPQKRKRIFIIGTKEKRKLSIEETKRVLLNKILLEKEKVPQKYFYSPKLINGFKRRDIINKNLGRGFGWRFVNPNETSYTISARYYKDGAEALVKYSENEIRKLTLKELILIQSFPRDYKFEEGVIKTYRQIGNAVPPKLAFAVAKSIKNVLVR